MSIMPGYPVPRLQWVSSGEACTACGKRFSFFTSKENCPCCGRLFCSSCLSAECTLTPMGLPSAICLECFQKIQDWRHNACEQRRNMNSASLTAAGSPSPPLSTTTAEAKLRDLEKEVSRAKENGRQLREENDSLLALLLAKDKCIAELTEEQKKVDASAAAAVQATEQAQQQLSATAAAQAEAMKALAELQAKLTTTQEINESLTEKINALLEANEVLKGRITKLDGEAAEHRAAAAAAAEELARFRELAVAASTQKVDEVEITKTQLQSVTKDSQRLRQERDDAVDNANTAAAEILKIQKSAQSWEAERHAQEDRISQLQAALESATERFEALQQQQQEAMQNSQVTSIAQLAAKQATIDFLTAQSSEMHSNLKALQNEREELEGSYHKEQQTRADLESRTTALLKEVGHYQEMEQAWNAKEKQQRRRLLELEEALARATHEAAAAEQREGSAAIQLSEKQVTIDSLASQLQATESTLQCLEADVVSARQEAVALQVQLRRSESTVEANLTASLAATTVELDKTRVRLEQQEESHAALTAQLSAKTRDFEELRRAHLSTANDAKKEIQTLRDQCTAARETYEAVRQDWLTSLTELRAALVQLEKERKAETNAAVAAWSVKEPAAPHPNSRWAQKSRVKEIQYPPHSFSHEDIPAVTGLDKWEFDTKAEVERAAVPDTLVRIGYQIALDWLLFPNITALQRWVHLLDTVQANYRANPYHNKIHAADVLQGVYALVLQCPGLFEHMTRMEKRAVVFAAAVHDIRHPGRTEAFIKNTFDYTYLHYNGCHVLEQMHTATAFELLGHAELDFTAWDMDDAEALQFHGLVVSLIASTYMGSHAALMCTWARPLREGGAYDFTKESDRHTVLAMLLHAADIGAQSRGVDVALKWLDVVEEMYQQGDEEAALGFAVSPGNERNGDLKKGQLFFMEMFVIPLFDLIHQLFPTMEAPIQNLRSLHAHYTGALAGATSRPFPSPVRYDAGTAAARVSVEAVGAREAAVAKREDKVAKREKTLEQAVLRLRQATAAVAQREAALSVKETQLTELGNVAPPLPPPTDAALQTEEKLLRATSAVVEREEAVQRKATELERLAAELEEREALASQLSSQLATIAERVNRQRQLLRYREARIRAKESPASGAGVWVARHEARSGGDRVTGEVFCTSSVEPTGKTSQSSLSPHHACELNKLKSALDKLRSAMTFM